MPLKVQFVRFRLSVPPPEEVDHPFHASLPSPPCLPPLPLLEFLLDLVEIGNTGFERTLFFLLEKALI